MGRTGDDELVATAGYPGFGCEETTLTRSRAALRKKKSTQFSDSASQPNPSVLFDWVYRTHTYWYVEHMPMHQYCLLAESLCHVEARTAGCVDLILEMHTGQVHT